MPFQSKTGFVQEKPEAKIKKSIFSLTINPNCPTDFGSKAYEDLRDQYNELNRKYFGDETHFKELVKFNYPNHYYEKHIKNVSIKSNIEYGSQNKNLHIQAFITIDHISNIHLDANKIRELFAVGDHGKCSVKINVGNLDKRNDEQRMSDYVDKQMSN